MKEPFDSYEQKFKAFCDELKALNEEAFADLDRLFQSIVSDKILEQEAREERRQQAKELKKVIGVDEADENADFPIEDAIQLKVLDEEEHQAELELLNEGQRTFFHQLTDEIQKQ